MKSLIAALACALMLAAPLAEARTLRVAPGPNAQTALQTALINAQPGDTVRLERGRYDLTAGLSLDVDNVRVEGEGQDRTILSFSGQRQGAEGLLVTSDGVTLADFAVENSKGDAIKARDCDRISFIGVRAEWTRGPHPENGAYGLYPVNCSNVLIERAIARGASDAGIYVGQSRNIVIRESLAERNVAGIEIENSFNADVHDNVARGNTGGVLVFDLPGLQQMGGRDVRVFNNEIVGNNEPNFAPPGNIVATVPAGTGVIVMANRNVHVFDNVIADHGTANMMIIAYRERIEDPNYNPLPRDVMIRDNRFGRSGFAPAGDFAGFAQTGMSLPDILWDGVNTYTAAGTPRSDIVRIAIRDNRGFGGEGEPTFLSLGLIVAGAPLSEIAPEATAPNIGRLQEPGRVRLPQD